MRLVIFCDKWEINGGLVNTTLIKQGNLYNDWGLLLEEEKNDEAAQQKYLLSEKYHLLALRLAEVNSMFLQQADNYDDLARLYTSRKMMPEAQKHLNACLKIIPPEY